MKKISLIALQGRNEIQAIRCAALVLFLIGAAYADDPPPPPIPPKPLRGTLVDPDAPPPAPPPVSLPPAAPAAPGMAPDVSSPPSVPIYIFPFKHPLWVPYAHGRPIYIGPRSGWRH